MAFPGGGDGMDGLSACECPVCFNFLSDSLPPMSMPCGHTLCSRCVDQLVAKATRGRGAPTFRCPLCRVWVNHDSVTLNHTLRDLIVQLASIGVGPATPPSHHGRVLSALHVDFSEIAMGESLDRGAFGEVFRGRWRGNDIAIKLFSSGILTPEAMRAFQQEVYVMNCLRHPNVVLLMGACQTPPKLAILMEFVGGGSLHKLIHVDKVPLPLDTVCTLGCDITRGLQYLHSINILHRDLKSKNVLLSGPPPSGQAKLCDFGLAKMRLESATLTGNVGTVHWSAPEVLANTRYKFPADVYSLGMVLYEMSCGRVPFGSMVPVAVMMAVAVQRQKPEIPSEVDHRLTKLITECISWEPEGRPPVATILTALHTITPPHTLTPTKERRAHLSHSDSLGMVFVSVTDTADLSNQGDDLLDVARNMGIIEQDDFESSQSGDDHQLAWQLTRAEEEAMLARDEELAHQLQLRENAYLTPSDTVKTNHPKKILDMIKSSAGKKFSPSKNKITPPQEKMTKALPLQQAAPVSKTKASPTQLPVSKTKAPPLQQALPVSKSKIKKKPTKSVAIENDDDFVPVSKKVSKTSKVKKHLPLSSHPPPPPPPPQPPPPPPPPLVVPNRKPPDRPTNQERSLKKLLMRDIRHSGAKTAQRLRPVETVEKRAFRVGRVVGGYSSEHSQFTVQNLVKSFNRRLLHHVKVKEPPPAFPVGRVIPPAKGTKVKRLSSLIEQKSVAQLATPTDQPTPPRRLHPAVTKEIAAFKAQWLNQVTTSVHNPLPSVEDILNERADLLEQSQPDLSPPAGAGQPDSPRLDPSVKADIVNFKKKMLNHVAMVIKQWNPTLEDIITEKKMCQSLGEESAESAPPSQTPDVTEPLDGFW